LKGASWQAAPGGFCYNTTLAEQYLGVKSPEEMQAKISDWNKFEETAEELYEATDGAVTITATIDGMWQCYASAANAPWVVDGKVNTQTATDFTNMLIPYVMNDYIDPTIEQWSTEWKTLGKENKTLGYFYSTWCLTSGTQLEENCGTEGNWNIVIGPQEYFWGGSWLCVSPKCDNRTEAKQFIKYFTSDAESMEKYALASGDFVNNKSVMEKISAGDYSNPLLGGQNQFAVLKDVAENIKLNESITPYDETLKQALRYALYSSIFNGNAQEVINEFLVQAKNDVPELFPEEADSQENAYPEAGG
ncbi:MAG: extracellular solute-binding protein, partial [Oscillospiraceae bacterium]|nr:extracellular solute-binding protein [Oscillospiraceae bacterium]